MFCPNCGTHQPEGKKFCTACGFNLTIISQALSGQLPAYAPPASDPREAERQRQMAKGVKMTIIGGALVAIQFFSFIFSMPFRGGGSPFSGFGFIGLIIAAIGISKIINSRPVYSPLSHPMQMPAPPSPPSFGPPRPVFSAQPPVSTPASQTNSFDPAPRVPSATEDETQHLPQYAPPREAPK